MVVIVLVMVRIAWMVFSGDGGDNVSGGNSGGDNDNSGGEEGMDGVNDDDSDYWVSILPLWH